MQTVLANICQGVTVPYMALEFDHVFSSTSLLILLNWMSSFKD